MHQIRAESIVPASPEQVWAVLADFASLDLYDIYVAGRFEMAAVVRESLRLRGVSADHLFGDAYQFI